MQIGNNPAALAALNRGAGGIDRPAPAAGQQQEPASKTTAREFEALFLTQAVDEMMKTVDLGSFGGGNAEETWRSFLARAIADEIAGKSSIGLANSVETSIAAYNKATGVGDR